MSQVAIVGAGVAGLLCARDLNRLGIACTVFEKSRGLGGRLARRQHAWGELGKVCTTSPFYKISPNFRVNGVKRSNPQFISACRQPFG